MAVILCLVSASKLISPVRSGEVDAPVAGGASNALSSRSFHTALQRRLFQAGWSNPNSVVLLRLLQAVFSLVAFLVSCCLLFILRQYSNFSQLFVVAICFLAVTIGFFAPYQYVQMRARAWRRRIDSGIADALDFMLVCVEAGQSLDLAIKRISEEMMDVHPDLSIRLSLLSQELAAGAERHEAFSNMAQLCESDDLKNFGIMVLQSSLLGTPISQTLRVYSADLRDRRIKKVEERAALLPTKMTLGTMVFTLPPLLILLLSPAVMRIISSM